MNTKANLQKALASLMVLAVLTSCTLNKGLDEIETAEGLISGVRNESGDVLIFKAVPFAAPPIGDLRWRGPQPVKPWDGVRLCDKWSASPFQNKPVPFSMYTKEWIPAPEPISEDCLYLNIWTPAKSANEKLPVLVWIYGGAFISGSGTVPIYDGEALAKQGIVYVSINYRLGIFGFMAHPELTQESQYSSSGNYGLMDQQAALMWIQKNISAFGGDPARVTIAGSSAGSISVNALVASPLSKGMFHGAIAQSGGIFPDVFSNSLKTSEGIGAEVMKKANASNLNELRKLSADTLLKIANTFPFYSFSPFVDRYLIPEQPLNIIRNKHHNQVPMMTGWDEGDGDLYGTNTSAETFKTFALQEYGKNAEEFLKVFPSSNDIEAKRSKRKLNLMHFASYYSYVVALENDNPTFLYQFSHVPTYKPDFPNYGAFHGSDIPYALHNLKFWDRPWQSRDFEMEKIMNAYWLNFVKTGNPNGNGLPVWKNYEIESGIIMEFNEGAFPRPDFFKAEFELMNKIYN